MQMQNHPLNKVVFTQKVAAFVRTFSPKDLFQLAYVNNSWNDTIKHYAFHIFEKQVRDIESVDTLGNVCDRAIKSNVIWFLGVLMSSETFLNRINLPKLVCKNKTSTMEIMRFVFEKIVEVGGKEMLKSQLMSTHGYLGVTCLMLGCSNFTSREVLKLLFEKIVEVGDKGLLKSQLTATTDNGWTCLMLSCRVSLSPEVVTLVFEKIVEEGDTALLKNELTATDNYNSTCLMLACSNSSSPEVVKLVLEKIVEVGGNDLLKSQLVATDRTGRTCLMFVCSNSFFPAVTKLVASVLFYFDLFSQQFEKLDDASKKRLKENANIQVSSAWNPFSASWKPDAESIAKVKEILARK